MVYPAIEILSNINSMSLGIQKMGILLHITTGVEQYEIPYSFRPSTRRKPL
jgi:hypothetical protein